MAHVLDERPGWAGIKTEGAGAALIESRCIRLERNVADDGGQEDPGSDVGVDETGVLPDPTEPGVLGIHPLLHRPGVASAIVGARTPQQLKEILQTGGSAVGETSTRSSSSSCAICRAS